MTIDDGMTRPGADNDERWQYPELMTLIAELDDAIGDYVSLDDRYLVADELFYRIGKMLRDGRTIHTPIGEFRPIGRTVIYVPAAHCRPKDMAEAMTEERDSR